MGVETRCHPGGEPLALAGAIEESLTSVLPRPRPRTEHGAQVWSGLDETGIFGIGAREECVGSGVGPVEEALIVAGSAAFENSGKNIQFHGGIGFSDEADSHLFIRRTQLHIAIVGGLEAANRRVANTKEG